MENQNGWKADLLGSVRPRKNIGAVLDPKEVYKPFESGNAVMYAFCVSCGLLYELTQDETASLFSLAGKPYEVERGLYFELGSCGMCKGDDVRVELRRAGE